MTTSKGLLGDLTVGTPFSVPLLWDGEAGLSSPNIRASTSVHVQVVFVFMMSIGNFVAFSIMKIYPVPVHHMLELMVL